MLARLGGRLQALLPSPEASPPKVPKPPLLPQAPQTANGLRAPRHVQRKRPQAPQACSPRTDPRPPGAFTANGPKPPQAHSPQTAPSPSAAFTANGPRHPQAHSLQTVPSPSSAFAANGPQAHSPQTEKRFERQHASTSNIRACKKHKNLQLIRFVRIRILIFLGLLFFSFCKRGAPENCI